MNIRNYFALAQRWAWLLILGLILGGGISYIYSSSQTPLYQASTRVQVMSAPSSGRADASAYFSDQQLAQTYIQTIRSRSIAERISQVLGYSVSSGQISAQLVTGTQLIDISVVDSVPEKAAEIANTLVVVFSERNAEQQAERFSEGEQSLLAKIRDVDTQVEALQNRSSLVSSAASQETLKKAQDEIARLEREILAVQTEINTLSFPAVLPNTKVTPTLSAETRNLMDERKLRLSQLQSTYSLYQGIYSNLIVMGEASTNGSDNLEQQRLQSTLALYQQIRSSLIASYENIRLSRLNSTSNIVPIDTAQAPGRPISPNVPSSVSFGLGIGIGLAVAIAFVVEYLDDTLKTPEQVVEKLNLPVIGYIGEMQSHSDTVYVSENPRSPISEAFRTLRTNLEFASVDDPIRTLLVVSVHPEEGKTTTATNLAITLAQGEKRVLIIDADMRRPRLHRHLGLTNRVGLSDLFREKVALSDVMRPWKDGSSLRVITSGGVPPNPADLLASRRMADILKEATTIFDIVIVDAPPFLVADASILASRVDGVLLVVRPGKTPTDTAVSSIEQLQRAGARVLGVTLNRIPRNRPHYYGGYRYYSGYYQDGHAYYTGTSSKGKSLLDTLRLAFLNGRSSGKSSQSPNGHTVDKENEVTTQSK